MKKNRGLNSEAYRYYLRYGIQGATSLAKRPLNYIKVTSNTSKEHFMGICSEAFDRVKMRHNIITEAYEKETGLRRDLVDIDDQEIIEIETDKQRAKRHKKEYTLIKVVI